MTLADARALMREYRSAGASDVILGGGEPSIHPDFISIVEAAKDEGFSGIDIKTNGVRFCYPEFALSCISAGADSFSVSVWGHSPEAHDMMAGMRGAFEMTEMGIKHLLHYGANVKLDYLMSAASCGRETEMVKGFCRDGLKRMDVWLFSIFGAGGAGRDMVPPMAAAGRAASAAAALAETLGCRTMTTQMPPCSLGDKPEMFYNVASLELLIVMANGRAFKAEDSPFEAGRHVAACAECGFNDVCPGPRIEYVERFGEAEFHPIPSRPA